MEVDQIQCEFPKVSNGNGSIISVKVGQNQVMDDQFPDNDEEGERKRIAAKETGVVGLGRYCGWPSSRIVRVTRASGGKDRHSKVLTSKGLRDRRVRLSVNTAIQFYDLQDRLGYDQPSKAVEWLLKAAASSIAELPPMSFPFPETPKQMSDDKRSSTGGNDLLGLDTAEVGMDGCDGDPSYIQQQQVTCSSNSENSKGSGLSLSRSENRIKARVRAKVRVAEKEKEKDQNESSYVPSLNPICQTPSFTELLNGGFNNAHTSHCSTSIGPEIRVGGGNLNDPTFFQKSPRHNWPSTSMDYFTGGFLAPAEARSGQMQFQTVDFGPDHLVSVGGNSNRGDNHHNGSREYNLNFTISSSGLDGFNRGTLQSNSSSPTLLPPLPRFPPTDGTHSSFFVGATAPEEYHHQFLPGVDARLQLFYAESEVNNGGRTTRKGKGKGRADLNAFS